MSTNSIVPLVHLSRNESNETKVIRSPVRLSVPATHTQARNTRRGKGRRFYLILVGLCFAGLAVALDITSVSVALPIIADDMRGTSLEAFWVGISTILAVVVVQPIFTSLSDVFGRVGPVYVSIVLMMVGSIIFAIAQDMSILILGRVVQGVGGGGLECLIEIIIADITTLQERAFYIGILAIPYALGSVLGPIIGASFSQNVSWRWIGWIELPILLIAMVINAFFLRLKRPPESFREKLGIVDWAGMVIFTLGMSAFALAVSWGGSMYAWGSWQTIMPLVMGSLTLLAFGFWERKASYPMLPRRIFNNRTVVLTFTGAFLHGLIMYTVLYYLPLYFEAVRGRSPIIASICAFGLSLTVVPFSGLAAIAVAVTRRYLWTIWLAWALVSLGLGLMSLMNEQTTLGKEIGFQIFGGVGLGALLTVPNLPAQAATAANDHGMVAGTIIFFRLAGAVVGLAIGSAVFSNAFSERLLTAHTLLPDVVKEIANGNEAVAFVFRMRKLDLPAPVLAAVVSAYAAAVQRVWLVLAGVSILGFLLSLGIKELTLEKDELGRQTLEQRD